MSILKIAWLALVSLVGAGEPAVPASPVLLPWHDARATCRQVVRVTAPVPRRDPVAEFQLQGPAHQPYRVVDAARPARALPVYRAPDGRVAVRVPGEVTPKRPRLLMAYWSSAPGWSPSPALQERPEEGDDYACMAHGDAWDFEEGDQEGISHWGDRPNHYGQVEVRGGRLIVPVTGNDPYFIWGVMWGNPDDPRAERIDSGVYRFLKVRLRQTCEQARWSLFVTDAAGMYEGFDFVVRGSQDQELSLDLADLFPGFWDGRRFRALRIDPTNDSPGTTVEIDWVKLLPGPTEVQVGPVLRREEVAARGRIQGIQAHPPRRLQAGDEGVFTVAGVDLGGHPVPHGRLAVALEAGLPEATVKLSPPNPAGSVRLTVPVGPQVGRRRWVIGVCDDLGAPAPPMQVAPLQVVPGALDHYELTADRNPVLVTRPQVTVTVWGADRFGNRLPVNLARPAWRLSGGAWIGHDQAGPLAGAPARVVITCASQPLTRHEIILSDARGHAGRLELMTMALKEHPIRLADNGYFRDDGGRLFLPLGGFYANWPSGLPDAAGALSRSVDLFPCGPVPYPHGFPWPPEVEKQVADYLQLCHHHGVTALRLMLRNMDWVGRVDPVQLQAVLHLLDLARPLGLRFNVVLFEDYDKPPYCNLAVLEKVVLPHYTAAQLAQLPPHRKRFLVEKRLLRRAAQKYTDPDVLACQKDYLIELLPYLAGREEIFCYEFENEMVFPPLSWVNEMTDFIRSLDPRTPILGNPGPHEWPEPWRWREAKCDLFSYHPYNDGTPQADHGAVVFLRSKWAAACGKPMFTGEGGLNQNRWQEGVRQVPPESAARGIRDQIWLSVCAGANGAFMWTAGLEAEMAEFAKVVPALEAVGFDLLKMKRRRPNTVLLMPEGDSANANAYALGWKLLSLGVDFDTLPAAPTKDYATRLEAASADPSALALEAEFFQPGEGYQLASLVAQDLSQALLYLRNVAGGIVNLGDGRPCYLRQPKPADAVLHLRSPGKWSQIRAFDLDAGEPVPVTGGEGGRFLLGQASSTHDFVIGLGR